MTKLTKEDAIEAIKKVEDPELFIDVYTLGLIYNIDIQKDNHITIDMTLTSPACPYGPVIVAQVTEELIQAGFEDPNIELVFDPPWEPSDEIKMSLGLL